MKRIFAILLIACMSLLVFTACNSSDDSGKAPVSVPNTPDTQTQTQAENLDIVENPNATYENFLSYIRTDAPYSSFRCYGEDSVSTHDHYVETYTANGLNYFSLVCEDEGIDYIIRYNTAHKTGDFPEIYADGEWINTKNDMNTFHTGINETLYSIILSDNSVTDNSIELYGETYTSKQASLENGIYVDYLCRNDKWDAVSISSVETDDTMIFENFHYSSTPSTSSRIAKALEAEKNDNKTAYFVISGSMEPTLIMGQMYVFEKVDFNTIEVGDIVLANYKQDGFSFTMAHRVVEITDEGLILRSDADNSINDPYSFTEDNVYGVLVEE